MPKIILARSEVLPFINPVNHAMVPDEVVVEELLPFDLLLHPNRFDLIAKYLYGCHRRDSQAINWATDLYSQHLKALNQYVEKDESGKRGLEKFLNSYDRLLDSIAKSGFSSQESLVPITHEGVVIDGAHRVAACAAYNKPVMVAYLDHYPSHNYSASFFQIKGMEQDCLDAMALAHCRLNQSCYIAVVFPVVKGKQQEIRGILQGCGRIIYEREVPLQNHGPQNFLKVVYADEPWLGNWDNRYRGTIGPSMERFSSNGDLRVIMISSPSLERIQQSKALIRDLFNKGNQAIHINDTHDEAVRIGQVLFNSNSVHFLNNAAPVEPPNFSRLMEEYEHLLESQRVDYDNLCIDGSAIMASYGIRDARDIDVLHVGYDPLFERTGNLDIGSHNQEIKYHVTTLDDIIFNPNNHYFYHGVKFATLEKLMQMKTRRGEEKDWKDIRSIEQFLSTGVIPRSGNKRLNHWRLRVRKLIPLPLHPFLRKSKNVFQKTVQRIPVPFAAKIIRSKYYKGYRLYYSYRTSLIKVVERSGEYEPQLSAHIVADLQKSPRPAFLDVGANIGLVSLNVLSQLPDAQVFAFEPGTHQYNLFQKTIVENDLENRIFLYDKALGKNEGPATFAVHRSENASGDGFFDTGRAGKVKQVTVQVTTLDRWWQSSQQPSIQVVKIDVEGAELFVLCGAERLVSTNMPVIYLEIWPGNLIPYPYDAVDILDWMTKHKYRLLTLQGIAISHENFKIYLGKHTTFVARPI